MAAQETDSENTRSGQWRRRIEISANERTCDGGIYKGLSAKEILESGPFLSFEESRLSPSRQRGRKIFIRRNVLFSAWRSMPSRLALLVERKHANTAPRDVMLRRLLH